MRLCARSLLIFTSHIFLIFSAGISFAQSIDAIIPKGKGPVEISSERMEYLRSEDIYRFDGKVVITQDKFRLNADHVEFNNRSGKVQAEGRVDLFDGENQLAGERIIFDMSTKNGVVYSGSLFIRKENYHLDGEIMEKLGERKYRLFHGLFTSCELRQGLSPDWHFKAKEMDLDAKDYLTAKGAIFYVKEIPIIYIPYISYPATRRSGLLTPRLGYSTKEGLKINEALYWAIAENQDATISLDYRSNKGRGTDLEYRYLLDRRSRGEFEAGYFRDMQLNANRIDLRFNHQQLVTEDLQVKIDTRYVNNPSNFRELSELTEERVQRSIESNGFIANRFDNSFLYILGRYTRMLETADSRVIQKIPEAGFSIIEDRAPLIPLFYTFNLTGSNLSIRDGIDAQRYDIHSRIALRLNLANFLILAPSADLRETIYSREDLSKDTIGREIYRFSLDAKTNIFKDFKFSDSLQIRHLIEPAGTYEFVPDLDQGRIPIFDDLDRIPAKNLITYSLTNRFIARYRVDGSGDIRRLEFLYVKLTQSYKRDDPSPLSDLRLETIIRPNADSSIEIDSFYDPHEGKLSSFNSDLKIRLERYLRLSFGQRYTKEGETPKKGDIFNPFSLGEKASSPEIRFLTGTLELSLTDGITIGSKAYYDLLNERFSEIDYGIRYDAGCWWFSLTYIDLPEKNQVSFLISLKGLGKPTSRGFGDMFKQ